MRFKVFKKEGGEAKHIGTFTVENGSIRYDNPSDEWKCEYFPSGKMSATTASRVVSLLNAKDRYMYLERV